MFMAVQNLKMKFWYLLGRAVSRINGLAIQWQAYCLKQQIRVMDQTFPGALSQDIRVQANTTLRKLLG